MKTKSWPIVGIISCACLTVLGLGAAKAQIVITVQNPSFELPAVGAGNYTGGNASVPGWTGTGGPGDGSGTQDFGTGQFNSADPLPAPADGNQALYINQGNSVYQDVGLLLANTTYTLTLAVGNRLDQPGGGIFELVNGTNNLGTALATSTLNTPAPGTFNLQTLSFTTGATVSGDLTIDLVNTVSDQVIFDNLHLTATTVPEPSAWSLLALGGIGLIVFMHHRRNQMVL